MTKELFKENLLDELKNRGMTAKITVENGREKLEMPTAYHGVIAFSDISLMYDDYKAGVSLDTIIASIEGQLNETPSEIEKISAAIDGRCMEKLGIYPALRSVSEKRRCPDALFTAIGDTDLVLGWKLQLKENPQGFVWLTEEMRKYLHITQMELHEAIKNLIGRSELIIFTDQFGVKLSFNRDLHDPLKEPGKDLTITLTCDTRDEGAVLLAFPEVREQLLKSYPGYRVIIPSSVNEVVLVHESAVETEDGKDYYKRMVKSINAKMVTDQDFLSNNIYYIEDDGSLKIL